MTYPVEEVGSLSGPVEIILITGAVGYILALVDPTAEHVGSSGLMVTLGAGMVVEGLAVLSKAMRSSGRVVWAKGRNDAPQIIDPHRRDG
jgi:hypothetical protein